MGAALLGGSGSVLFAGSAQAACAAGSTDELSATTWIGGTPLTCDDKVFTYNPVGSTGLPTGSTDTVSATVDDTGTYLFLYDFLNPDFDPIATFTLNYTAMVTNPDDFFTVVDIDSNVPTTQPSEDLIATYTNIDGELPGASVVLQSINGNQNPPELPVLGHPTKLSVSNVYFSNGGSISEFQNSYRQGTKVPGPLPLLGAGMAFGFSRKLRSRIKTRVQA